MTNRPQVQDRPAQPYVGVRRTVTMTTMGRVADRIPEIIASLQQRGIEPAGAPFLRYLVIDMATELVVEAGVPVTSADVARQAAGAVEDGLAAELPSGRYVVARHHGHPDQLERATADLLAWAAEHDLAWDVRDSPEGDVWGCRLEIYLSDPRAVAIEDWETDLVFMLAR